MATGAEIDEDGPPFPLEVRIAGWIWTSLGGGLTPVLAFFWIEALYGRSRLEPAVFYFGLMVLAILFLRAGIQTLRGRLPKLLPVGLASIAFGLFELILGALLERAPSLAPPVPLVQWTLTMTCGAHGLLMVVAGLLALTGCAQYRKWWKANEVEKTERIRRWW